MTWSDENHFLQTILYGKWMDQWYFSIYDSIDKENFNFMVQKKNLHLLKWIYYSALNAIEPCNKTWDKSMKVEFKRIYKRIKALMKSKAPHLQFVFHDAILDEKISGLTCSLTMTWKMWWWIHISISSGETLITQLTFWLKIYLIRSKCKRQE